MQKQRGVAFFLLVLMIIFLAGFILLGAYLLKLDNIVRKRFDGQRWDIPAKVYARPLEIYSQSDSSPNDIRQELKLLGYKKSDNYDNSGTFQDKNNQLYIHTRGFDFGDNSEPERIIELTFNGEQISAIRTTQPSTTGILRLEPLLIGGIYPQHNEDRVLVKLQNVPQPLIDALLATEDHNFYQHHGISIRGTARALLSNATGGARQGGSTLTQQLVKNFFLTPERTYKRKINEAFMALLLELHYRKDDILESYLNEVNLGQNGNYSVNGYGLAAQFYFGQPLKELNTAQLAFLVGLVNGPSYYNPWRNPERALDRRNIVLNNMLKMGKLTEADYEKEKSRPLGVASKPALTAVRFPDFMDIVRRQLRQEYQDSDLSSQGLRIFTTLDPVAQTRIEQSVENTVERLKNSNPSRLKHLQGAVIVSHPENGEIVAALGSTNGFTGFNRVLDAKRQVGSLLKPVIYMQALQSGRYTWASLVQDSAIVIRNNSSGKDWTPKNYSGGEHGQVLMQTALANSYNLAAVRVGWDAGLTTFINNLKMLGIQSDIPNYPSVLLGAVNFTPMQVLGLYQNFAAGGFNYPTRTIRSVIDANGRTIQRYALQVKNNIDPSTAYLVNYGLQQVIANGTGKAATVALPNLNLAGKSGTTNDARDSWFAGYSGNYLTVVWLGDDQNQPIGLTGSSGALPVWIGVMQQLKNKNNEPPKPDNIEWQWIDPAQGMLSAQECLGSIYIPMLINTIPRQATACAAAHYQVESTPESIPNDYPTSVPNPPDPNPNNQSGIQESIEPPPPKAPQVLSQGGYNDER